MRLQLTHIGQSQLLHHCLTLCVALPSVCRRLIATDVNLAVGEHFYYLIQHILRKLQHQWACHIQHIGENTSVYLHVVCSVRIAAEFGVGSIDSTRVTGELNFGHNLDMTLCRVCNNLAALLLSIEIWAVRLACIVSAIYAVGNPVVVACSSNCCQTRVFLHFKTPSLVIGKMPVEAVHLVIRHYIEHTFYLLNTEVMTAYIKHKTAILEARSIDDTYNRQ